MAFLSTTDRFGPVLDKYRDLHPNPSTYEPVNVTIADGVPFRRTSRYGTIGPHHDVPLECHAAASPAAKMLAAVEMSPTSINGQRRKAPTPWHYTPTIEGEFARIYTVEDLEVRRKQRIEAATRTAAGLAVTGEKPVEVLHLALGPGTYEVDKDWNLEPLSVPFSFGKEPRRGILECSVGAKDLYSDRRRVSMYAKKLGAEQRRRSETALLPLRRASPASIHTKDAPEIAALSKELAKSYAEVHRHAARIETQLSSSTLRTEKYQRFTKPARDIEAFRRGPGSYFDPDASSPTSAEPLAAASFPMDETQQQELADLLKNDKPTKRREKKRSTFGLVKHRDMLTSMLQAGHLSAVAVDDTLGPGVYETATSTFHEPSHNLRYNAKSLRKRTPVSTHHQPRSEDQEPVDASQEIRERWRAMRRGPTIPTSS